MAVTRATYVALVTVAADDTDPTVANLATLRTRVQTALTTNATYLALASPSTAQNTAQIQALTKECNGLIRLLLNQLDSTTGT
jgi:uncharacterized protein involved in exopolysaccharide biosynthesis